MAYVLIVDDEDSDRLLLKSLLAPEGHEIFEADNGESALQVYLRQPIEVVVSDLQMPRGDGHELIEALLGLDPDAAIVAVSGAGSDQLADALEAGALEALAKPIEKEDFVDAVNRALQRKPAPPA